MRKTFNTDGYCDPELNYMVDLTSRLGDVQSGENSFPGSLTVLKIRGCRE